MELHHDFPKIKVYNCREKSINLFLPDTSESPPFTGREQQSYNYEEWGFTTEDWEAWAGEELNDSDIYGWLSAIENGRYASRPAQSGGKPPQAEILQQCGGAEADGYISIQTEQGEPIVLVNEVPQELAAPADHSWEEEAQTVIEDTPIT